MFGIGMPELLDLAVVLVPLALLIRWWSRKRAAALRIPSHSGLPPVTPAHKNPAPRTQRAAGPTAHICFSYARADGEFALKLATSLRSSETNLRIDQLNIRAGAP